MSGCRGRTYSAGRETTGDKLRWFRGLIARMVAGGNAGVGRQERSIMEEIYIIMYSIVSMSTGSGLTVVSEHTVIDWYNILREEGED